jgi:hypothetical protein
MPAAITLNKRICPYCIVAASVQALTIAARALNTRKPAVRGYVGPFWTSGCSITSAVAASLDSVVGRGHP